MREDHPSLKVNKEQGFQVYLDLPFELKIEGQYVYFGELNKDGESHGRGLEICGSGTVYLHHFKNG